MKLMGFQWDGDVAAGFIDGEEAGRIPEGAGIRFKPPKRLSSAMECVSASPSSACSRTQ
jgi:hypothetical protein